MPTLTITPTAVVTPSDRVRQVGVTLAEVFCIVGTLIGIGVLGTRVQDSSGGALSAEATRIAPAGPAFSIWSVVYLGLLAYTVWQWIPRNATSRRTRSTGWLAAASMVLNAAWLLVTQQGWIWVSVIVILALALVLGVLLRRLTSVWASGTAERVVVDGTFGLYLGWVAVAACANVTAAFVSAGIRPNDTVSDLLAVVVLAVAAGLGLVLAARLGGRYAVAVAMAWGLGWIAVGRVSGSPTSWVTAIAAAVAAVVVVGAAVLRRRTDGASGAPSASAGRLS